MIYQLFMRLERSECYDPIATYTVEIPVKEHNTPEIKEAKEKKIQNSKKNDIFGEIEDCGHYRIGSRWVISQKEKADGQKKVVKLRLVARGFQEKGAP